ncbi:BLUF domain-containing protein [Polaribacter glomeratus]|uniref:BLUF domain-containing protein n=1 Tax=Polaribacter glomeratus TaxID=102 RepID=A0A2S7WXA3_9FLAO|nr:BLUF domain-containing protein [Polaribacter glomeratus]PQJ82187.1 hypothetical protein BTO16_06185 [Polaribacter glomeratus]TXD66781.1 BLUF domain-containing protein [Polaribacter glomeratus]
MFELVYYSISNTEITTEIVNDILKKSRATNAKKNITGCLLFYNKVYLQLLEGEKEAVQELYEKIKRDTRHYEVTLLVEHDVPERMFPGWSMAFHESINKESDINQFINNIDFFSKNNDLQTEATDMFLRMAKHIVVK